MAEEGGVKDILMGFLMGFVCFFGSFVLLYVNEGAQKISEVIKNATVVSDGKTAVDGAVVYTGVIKADAPVKGDDYITSGNFLSLKRETQIYAWEEVEKKSDSTTDYSYKKRWVWSPDKTSTFKYPVGHENRQKTISDSQLFAEGVRIGEYTIDTLSRREGSPLHVHAHAPLDFNQITILKGQAYDDGVRLEKNGQKHGSNKLFVSKDGTGSQHNPEIGDHRISYLAAPLDVEMTFVGALQDGKLQRNSEPEAFDIFLGNADEAYATAKKEDTARLWGTRLGGFLLMLLGLWLILSFPTMFLNFIPFGDTVGGIARFILFLALIPVALILSTVTILISILIHNPIVLIATMALITTGLIVFLKRRGKSASRPSESP